MRRRYVQAADGRLIEVSENYRPEPRKTSGQVMPDIAPYKSMIDGTIIGSRSVHREHLRQHGCVEIGNDSSLHHEPRPLKSPPGLKEKLIQAAHQHLRSK